MTDRYYRTFGEEDYEFFKNEKKLKWHVTDSVIYHKVASSKKKNDTYNIGRYICIILVGLYQQDYIIITFSFNNKSFNGVIFCFISIDCRAA